LTEGANTAYSEYGAIFCEKYPDARFLKPHTGQSFTLGDVKIDVMFTHEDMVKADTGTLHLRDVNNTSTVMKLTVHGKTFLLLGDLGTSVKNPYRPIVEDMRLEARFLGMYSAKHGSYPALESDAVQVSHHAFHYYRQSEFYCAIRARYAMLPMADVEYGDYQPSFYCHVIQQLFVTGAEHILPAGRKTQWLAE
jgi:beta-lactamase superfamily II metal-dependent hydrolase